mgnify:CR=1 FL=1
MDSNFYLVTLVILNILVVWAFFKREQVKQIEDNKKSDSINLNVTSANEKLNSLFGKMDTVSASLDEFQIKSETLSSTMDKYIEQLNYQLLATKNPLNPFKFTVEMSIDLSKLSDSDLEQFRNFTQYAQEQERLRRNDHTLRSIPINKAVILHPETNEITRIIAHPYNFIPNNLGDDGTAVAFSNQEHGIIDAYFPMVSLAFNRVCNELRTPENIDLMYGIIGTIQNRDKECQLSYRLSPDEKRIDFTVTVENPAIVGSRNFVTSIYDCVNGCISISIGKKHRKIIINRAKYTLHCGSNYMNEILINRELREPTINDDGTMTFYYYDVLKCLNNSPGYFGF